MKDARDFKDAHAAEQDLDLGALEHRGRLVEQDHQVAAGVLLERQRLGELDHLARGEIEILGAHARIDIDLHLRELSRRSGVERAPVDDAEAGELRLVAEIDVLADGEVGQERLLLEHHADALAVGVGRIEQPRRLPGDQDLPGVGLIDAAQDLHQRRLAGAVLADQADDLATADLDRHALQRVDAGKALVDRDERERGVVAAALISRSASACGRSTARPLR